VTTPHDRWVEIRGAQDAPVTPYRITPQTPVRTFAKAVARELSERGELLLEAEGAGAVNQAVKVVAAARSWLVPAGKDCHFQPSFDRVDPGDETSIRLHVRAVAP
jgi:stage V sporulation protein SpoVS